MKLYAVIFALLCALSAPVYAEDDIDPQFFSSWLTLNDLLHAKGIDVNRASWTIIEHMCAGLRLRDDKTAYHRCLYEKVLDEHLFRQNFNYCKEESDDNYPDSLINTRKTRTYTETDNSGRERSITETVQLYASYQELKAARRTAFRDCMRSFYWQDPNNWKAGRQVAEPASKTEKFLQAPDTATETP